MLERDLAAEALRPLGHPTMNAFNDARTTFTKQREDAKKTRDRFARPVGAVVDGINYWGLFATSLVEEYEHVPGVARVENCHPLSHYWTIGNITIQLKSDTGNLPLDQLVIPGVNKGTNSLSEVVILPWDHDHSERYAPAFVQLEGKRETWRLPITALVAEPVTTVTTERRKATVTSSRPDIAAGSDAATAEQP